MLCPIHNIRILKPILDVPTRWNSTYEMCARALVLRIVLDAISRTDLDLRQYILSEEDWEKIELLVSILAPFKEG